MNDSILFLGTGGDIFTVGKQSSASGGIILNAADMQFHIDPGPGALNAAKEYGINIRNNIAVLSTSDDLILSNDVAIVAEAMTHRGLDTKGVMVVNKDVFRRLDEKHKGYVERCIQLEPGSRVGINEVEIRAIPCFDSDNIGLKFFTPNFVMTYSSFTSYNSELIEHYKGSDVLILCVLSPEKTQGYLSTEEARKIAEKVKPQMLVLTGSGIKMKDFLSEARKIQKETGIQTLAAREGMTINPTSYNANMKQKTLRNY